MIGAMSRATSLVLTRQLMASVTSRPRFCPLRAQSTEARPSLINSQSSDLKWTIYPVTTVVKNYNLEIESSQKDSSSFFAQFVSHELGLERDRVQKIYTLYKNEIERNYPNNESIIHLCKFLKLFFRAEEFYYNSKPFLMPYREIYNRMSTLKELGFRSFKVSQIDSVTDFLHLTPNQLKTHFNYSSRLPDCLDSLCKSLNIYGDDKEKLLNIIKTKHGPPEEVPLHQLRVYCVAKYLSTTLKISFNRIIIVCKRYHRMISETSLTTIKSNVEFLARELKYPGNKIIHNALFLSTDPENLHAITTKLKPVMGQHVFDRLITQSQVLKLNHEQILQNYELVKSKCNGKFFSRASELLSIEPQRLCDIFSMLETNEDIKSIGLGVLGLDYLALHRHRIMERIAKLKEEEIPLSYMPISFFHATTTEFDTFLADLTNDPELRIRFYLENHFGLDYESIKSRLTMIPNINAERYNRANANRIIEFFISMNVPKEQIVNGIYLILYDYKQVKSAYFNACSRYDKASDQIHQNPNFFNHIFDYLQLVH